MIEKHFFADPDTPFHVWVRERNGAQGYRWVLRDASKVIGQGDGVFLQGRECRSDTIRPPR